MQLGNFSISLAVQDIHKPKKFYQKLGFAIIGGKIEKKWLSQKNDSCVMGLFEGMFERNILTFNPGWDSAGEQVNPFTDIRQLQSQLKSEGITLSKEADETTSGPDSFMLEDPDGNSILFDQHR